MNPRKAKDDLYLVWIISVLLWLVCSWFNAPYALEIFSVIGFKIPISRFSEGHQNPFNAGTRPKKMCPASFRETFQWLKFPLNGWQAQCRISPVVWLLTLASGPACLGMAFPPFLVKQLYRCDSVISSFVRTGYTTRWGWLLGRIGCSITHHYPLYPYRIPRNRLPRVMKYYSPTGRRNHGGPLKRLLDTRDRNESTSSPTPWKIYNDDDDKIKVAEAWLLSLRFVNF